MEKYIIGFEGLYKIDDYGHVWSLRSGRLIAQTKTHKGYLSVHLTDKKNIRRFNVHRLVALLFIPNPQNKPEVNHINGIKTDNRVENLEWVTTSENRLHAFKIGLTSMKGEKHSRATLTNEDVLNIRELYKKGNPPVIVVANIYNVNRGVIYNIKKNISWNHI